MTTRVIFKEQLANMLIEILRKDDDGAWIGSVGVKEEATPDLKHVIIDGRFDLIAVSEELLKRLS